MSESSHEGLEFLKGHFIVVEGPDGCGKSSVVERLEKELQLQGVDVVRVREPGTTKLGEALRETLLHDVATPLCPEAQVLLFSAARAQLCQEVIAPALSTGKVVLSDRFWPSTIAYQGGGMGVDWENIIHVQELAVPPEAQPTVIAVLDVPVRIAAQRMAKDARKADKFESLGREFHQRVRLSYLELCARNPLCKMIDASGTVEETYADTLALLVTLARQAPAPPNG